MQQGEDYYFENGLMVFTKEYHLKRGYCCQSGCRHCPYGFRKENESKEKVAISWSGGKDCAMALHEILRSQLYEIYGLHTSFDEATRRVGLHGIRQSLIEQQAKSLGFKLDSIFVPASMDHDSYENRMKEYYQGLKEKGVSKIIFGDIFLEDLRKFRERLMKECGLEAVFPLWKSDSLSLAMKFINSGFKAAICSADEKYFRKEAVGRGYDLDFINSLPDGVDPCGERGEFHTFVFDGPIFRNPVLISAGARVEKKYDYKVNQADGSEKNKTSKFWFQDFELTVQNTSRPLL